MRRVLMAVAAAVLLSAVQGCGLPQPDTPLTRAVEEARPAAVQELLSRGADPDEKDSHGLTPLIRASRRGDAAIVQALLAAHADPNLRDRFVTREGWTPLMNAVHKNQLAVVRLLLASGADVNFRTEHGNSALLLASGDAGSEIVEALLEAGADPRPGRRGSAALTNAVVSGHTQTVRALLAKDPELMVEKGIRGEIALSIAKLTGRKEILELLRQAAGRKGAGPDAAQAGRRRTGDRGLS